MAGIEKKLTRWERNGLITPNQVDEILAFEGEQSQPSNWWLYSVLLLGAFIVGLGIISTVAAHWMEIPDAVKLGTDFLLLSTFAVAIVWVYDRLPTPWFDALIMGFMLLCLASIGLIAQIYHINGYWYHALLLWAMMTLPIAVFARHLFIHFFWVSLFIHGFTWSCVALTGGELRSVLRSIPALLLFSPLASALFYLLTRRVNKLTEFSSSFYFWLQISALVALAAIDIMRSNGEHQTFDYVWYLPAWIAAALLISLIISAKTYSTISKALLTAALVLLVLYYDPNWLFTGQTRYADAVLPSDTQVSIWRADDIRAPILTISILFLYAIHSAICGHNRTFNLMTFLIGLRFVVLYFQALGGLAATGTGLIVSGLLIIGVAWLWYSSREQLQRWSKGLTL